MNNPSERITARALKILERLVNEIGPRPAGSAAEKNAQEMAAAILAEKGYQARWFEVPFRPQAVFFPHQFLAALGLIIAAQQLAEGSPWPALLMPIAIAALPELIWLVRRSLPAKGGLSSNLLVWPDESRLEDLDLILCAHVDTARAHPASGEMWRQWRSQVFKTTLRMGLILSILALMNLIGFTLPPAIPLAGQIFTSLLALVLAFQDMWEQLASRGRFTPGANDNASGAAVTAALAEFYGETPPERARVAYLFSGAEECGLYGARQFAGYLAENHLKPLVLSVDMVGAGFKLRAVSGAGSFLRIKSDPDFLELLERADPAIERLHYDRRSGDFEPFVRAGIPAAGIEADGTRRSWQAYHAETDDLNIIDAEMLAHTVETLRQLIWLIDKGKK